MNTPYEEAKIQLLPHSVDEKWAAEQDDLVNSCDLPPRGQCCHSKKWKRDAFLKAAIIGLAVTTVALIGLFVMSTFCPGTYSLLKRATTQSNDNAFINHKLYIIVICVVGVILCLVLGICVAGCCCRESFRNPICCPCYTVACCGCLACLECIGCGLCFEGMSEL